MTAGNYNVGLGAWTCRDNLTGSDNTAVGYAAGYSALGSKNVFLGFQAGFLETGSNKLYIENSDATVPLIYGEFDNDFLRVNGTLSVSTKIGIGTPSPEALLDVNGAALMGNGTNSYADEGLTLSYVNNSTYAANSDISDAHRVFSIVNESTTTNSYAAISLRSNPAGATNNQMLDLKLVNPNDGSSKLIFAFGPNGAFSDHFTMTSAGNLGIGTTSPAATLDVTGSIKTSYSGSSIITVTAGSTTTHNITVPAMSSDVVGIASSVVMASIADGENAVVYRARVTSTTNIEVNVEGQGNGLTQLNWVVFKL